MPVYFETATIGTNIVRAGSAASWLVGFPESDTGSISSPGYTDYIFFSGFGFTIPSTDTILGVVVQYQTRCLGTFSFPFGPGDAIVQLGFSGGPFEGSNRAQPAIYSESIFTTQTRGAANDLWGWSAIAPTDINNSTFGFGLSSILPGTGSTGIFEVLTGVTMSIATNSTVTRSPTIYPPGSLMMVAPNAPIGGVRIF